MSVSLQPSYANRFVVDEDQRGKEPLRGCVREALENYFTHLNGHPATGVYQMVLAEVEEPLLEAVLHHTGSNQSQAAEILGISRSTLRKKLAKYGLDKPVVR